jgi:hypothetical protein
MNRRTSNQSTLARRGLVTDKSVTAHLASIPLDLKQSAKELVRHFVFRAGMGALLDYRRRHRGFKTSEHIRSDAAETFRAIYSGGVWVHGAKQESLSGIGSEVEATHGLVEGIEALMMYLGCNSLVDVGCGDWNWFRRSRIGFKYTGVDIVPEVIERNSIHEGPGIQFAVCNAIVQPLPVADLAFCREVLFHLSLADARQVILNIAHSAKFMCATTDVDILFNSDIPTGDFRAINLMRRPFSLPAPVCLIPDQGHRSARYLAVWSCETIRYSAAGRVMADARWK